MKKISVVIPCYNEERSVMEMYRRLTAVFEEKLSEYDYEIIYVDDYSKDDTRQMVEALCGEDKKVKAVFNAKNFGFHRNVYQSLQYGSGDAVFLLFGDLQDPPEMLPEFVKKWEQGSQVIVGQRKKSDEGFIMQLFRRIYYKVINVLSDTEQIELFNGFGLYDRVFIDVCKKIDVLQPFFKAVVAEYGMNLCIVQYEQAKSNRGKSNFNFWKNYDFAMQGLTTSTKMLMRLATFVGGGVAILSIIIGIWVLVNKLLNWETYPAGTASILVGVFFIGAMQLFFIGILGEYILSINSRIDKKPRVIVEKKINF
jgi:glycosyltransferase involved in cell wall biosynthesis